MSRSTRWCMLAMTMLAFGRTADLQVRAETHRFIPDHFYNTYSFAHPPALRIKPGDRVATKTIDAAGVDWDGKSVASGPNPQTGPFYIEGAEPGDMLVVVFDKIEPNRATAYGASRLPEYAVVRFGSIFSNATTSTSPGSAPSM